MIRFLSLILFSVSLFIHPITVRAATDIDISGTSADKTIYENINAIPQLSYASSSLNASFFLDIAAAMADCANVIVSGENVKAYTVFVPTNDALKEALDYYRRNWGSTPYGPSEEQQQLLISQAIQGGKIDVDSLGVTEEQKNGMRARMLYSIIPGECTDADLTHPVQFMPTLLQPKITIQVTHDPKQAELKRKSQGLSRSAATTRTATSSKAAGDDEMKLSDRTKEILRSLSTDFSNAVKLGADESQRLQIINLNAPGDLASVIGYESSGVQYKNSSIKIQFPAHAAAQRLQPPTASRPPSNTQPSQQLPDSGSSAQSGRGLSTAQGLAGKLEQQEERGLLQSNVIRANIRSSNGMLHIVDRLLITPLSTNVHLKLAKLNHTIDALAQSSSLKNQINDKQQMTFFAPSEQAWKDFISRYQNAINQQDQGDDDDSDQQAIRGKTAAPSKQPKKVKKPYQNLDSKDDSPTTNVLNVFTQEQLDAIINAHLAFDVVLYSSAIGKYQPEADNSDLTTRSAIRSLAKTKSSDTLQLPVRQSRQIGGSIITTNDAIQHSVRKAGNRGFAIDDALIVYPNIMTKNGVIHVINKFLITPQQLIQMQIKRKPAIKPEKPSPTVAVEQPKKSQPGPTPPTITGNLSVPAGQTCLNLTALALLPTLKPQSPSPALDCPEGDQICYVLDITQSCEADTIVQGDARQPTVGGKQEKPDTPAVDEPRLSAKCPPLLIGSRQASRSYSRSRAAKSFRLLSQSQVLPSNFTDQTQLNYIARCYSPKTHVCVNNHFLCPVTASSLCGNQCYDATKYRCFSTFSLCPAAASSYCFGACYDKNAYTCTASGLQQKKKQ